MPHCVICDSKFYHGGYMSQAEPCDCGACLTQRDIEELTPEEYERVMHPDRPDEDGDGIDEPIAVIFPEPAEITVDFGEEDSSK